MDQLDTRYKLYSFWNTLPATLEFEEKIQEIANQEYRKKILTILSKGIEDERQILLEVLENIEGITDKNIRRIMQSSIEMGLELATPHMGSFLKRFGLSADEIRTQINNQTDEKITFANTYFHLKVLEENGLVQHLGSIQRNGQSKKYYGRTAKIFVFRDRGEDVSDTAYDDLFLQVIGRIDPDVDVSSLVPLLNRIQDRLVSHQKYRLQWFEQHQRQLSDLDIDLQQLFNSLQLLVVLDPDFVEAVSQIAPLLDFPGYN